MRPGRHSALVADGKWLPSSKYPQKSINNWLRKFLWTTGEHNRLTLDQPRDGWRQIDERRHLRAVDQNRYDSNAFGEKALRLYANKIARIVDSSPSIITET
jgi:hypothetical protein